MEFPLQTKEFYLLEHSTKYFAEIQQYAWRFIPQRITIPNHRSEDFRSCTIVANHPFIYKGN
jgi:hypothetical protein